MMINILGAGAIGCLWAARLALASQAQPQPPNHVPPNIPRFVLNQAYAAAKGLAGPQRAQQATQKTQPLRYLSPTEQSQTIDLDLCVLDDISPQLEGLLLVCTKSYNTLAALEALRAQLAPDCAMVLFQNGMGSQAAVCEAFADFKIYAAVSTEGGTLQAPFTVKHAGLGHTYIGPLSNRAKAEDDSLEICTQLQASGLSLSPEQNIRQRLVDKVIINCAINPFTALERCLNGEVPNTSLFKTLWPALRQELATFSALEHCPRSEEEIDAMVFKVIAATASNRSSMLQDVEQQRATEIDSINGHVARTLERHDVDAQHSQHLWERVNEL